MSLRKIQKDSSMMKGADTTRTIWVGGMNEEQKPKLCSRCGKPVVMAYRVYKREFNRQRGEWQVVKGQYEIAHIMDNTPVWDVCPYPSLLEQLQMRIDRERIAKENEGEVKQSDKRTVHLESTEAGSAKTRVWCGARGSLWTTLDRATATCFNCLQRSTADIKPPNFESSQGQSTGQSNTQKENQNTMAMTAEQIKAKIAAGKAAKAEGGAAQGAAATLVQDAPLPKATQTKAQAKKAEVEKKQVEKAAKTPKALNLCGCGCGAGVKSNFVPGHDAKLHSWIGKLAKGTMALTDLPAQVVTGMYPKVKQSSTKDDKGKVSYSEVAPVCDEKDYLATLAGKGGMPTA